MSGDHMADIYTGIVETGLSEQVFRLSRAAPDETHFVIENGQSLLRLCQWVQRNGYYLCTMVASDERLLEDNVFKIYYVLSGSQQDLLILENPLTDTQHPTEFTSIREAFPSVAPLEEEACDLLGLSACNRTANDQGFMLHAPFPIDLYPLRRTRSLERLRGLINDSAGKGPLPLPTLPEGMLILPVGPIHAGVIEAGHFSFHVAGEVVEELSIRLGYKHKGIEKLFETYYSLEDGQNLAEKVSGDSSFAHSMAYCQAVEALAGEEPPEAAQYWRALFLEMERLYNHIADIGALVHDMAFDLLASPMFVLREAAVQLNKRLTGHRLLRGVNKPGGVELSGYPDLNEARKTIEDITADCLRLSKIVLEMPACRDRAITTGLLTQEEVAVCGATGMVARASGIMKHDFRLRHPQGPYRHQAIKELIEATSVPTNGQSERQLSIYEDDLKGDVYARMVLRVAEVETSSKIIQYLIDGLTALGADFPTYQCLTPQLRNAADFDFGLGFVEGWRGDIFYFVMKGPDNSIFRCKVRDPSVFNWPAESQAVVRKLKGTSKTEHWENILADFPLINKSFNLSYAGHDL
jgi:Ni,Fe-hydrogenase III large subunit/Ni,Fe-hydrogenase III component G